MRLVVVIGVLAAGLALPAPAAAHSLVGRLNAPLPLVVYLAGAGLAVALSFAFVMLRDSRPAPARPPEQATVPQWLAIGLRAVGLIAWIWIVAQTLIGGSSAADVSTLFLSVYGWVGVAMLSAFVGPVWVWLDPFTTIYDICAAVARRVGLRGFGVARYPRWLDAWPAAAGLAFFVWVELVYLGSLGVVLIGYTLVTLAMMAVFGRDTWRANGETFSVWFGLLNRVARYGTPPGPETRRVPRRPLFAGLLEPGWSNARLAVVAIGTGSILFDGLSQTQIWFNAFGLPTIGPATLLLAAFLASVVALALAVGRLVGVASVAAGLVPIAVGYLVAHYLTYLLGDGQRIIVVLSDPLQLGWDLFGTAFFEPSADWLPASLVWTIMLASVVGGHVVGAWAGHSVAVREAPRQVDVRMRQVPLAALMVALTVTTLWSLGQTIVLDPGTASYLPADPGTLDRSFSSDGVRYIDFGDPVEASAVIAGQSPSADRGRIPAD